MPKAAGRKRTLTHNAPVKFEKRFAQAAATAPSENVKIGSMADASAFQILESISEDATPAPHIKKKEKQQLRHQAFIERLQANQSPYSKSHQRRLKRKEKEQLSGRIGDLSAVLDEMDPSAPTSNITIDIPGVTSSRKKGVADEAGKPKPKAGQIGEGKGVTLTAAQRKKALKIERMRTPLIQANPEFAANPFATIRLHAQNTLIPHNTPSTSSSL